jgi:tetratricopeptide (TPR) repeat protein
LVRQPWLLAGVVVLWLLRGLLPPPGALFGALGRAGRLREQVRVNRANITARRDLATIYLSLLRPRRALPLLAEALAMTPHDPELLYLHGTALERAGRHEEAIAQLLQAIDKDQRLRSGHAYFVAGEALLSLKRWDDAADAFERYLDFSSSDVTAHTQLARAYAGAGDSAAARKWLLAGIQTWQGLSGSFKRRQLGAYFKAQWARVAVLKDAAAIVVALGLAALLLAGASSMYPVVARLWRPSPGQALAEEARVAAKACGTLSTGDFEGRYDVSLGEEAIPGRRRRSRSQRDDARAVGAYFSSFRIERDRISISGEDASNGAQEFCLTKVLDRSPQSLHAQAVVLFWPTKVDGEPAQTAPVPSMLIDLRLDRGSELTRFRYAPVSQPLNATLLDLRRQP